MHSAHWSSKNLYFNVNKNIEKINIFNLEHNKIDGHECMCRGSMSHCVKPKKKKFKHSASINVEKKPT